MSQETKKVELTTENEADETLAPAAENNAENTAEDKAAGKEQKTLTQEQVNEIVKNRLREEKQKAEREKAEALEQERLANLSEADRLKEELAAVKAKQAELEDQSKRDAFEKRLLAAGVDNAIATQLLGSVSLDAMADFDLEPFKNKVVQTITPQNEAKKKDTNLEQSMQAFAKYL